MLTFAGALLVAVAIEACIGWPSRLYQLIGHPVTWLGRLIGWLDGTFNRETAPDLVRRLLGLAAALAVIAVAAGAGWIISQVLPEGLLGVLLGGLCAWPLVAGRSMYDHVMAVAVPLQTGDLAAARGAVAMIVGRDPERLDAAGVASAALESLAENTSDGVVAPIFWGVIFGLPGIAGYKAINTLDSMIGHRTPRHEAFGWASARIDDVANLVPARLTGLLFVVVSGSPGRSFMCMLRDAGRHRSPNAGWPEAAMAGALGVRLSGPRSYGDRVADEPWLYAEGRAATAFDITHGLRVFVRALALLAAMLAALVLI